MQVTYTIQVKRTTLLSNAEVFAINNLNHEQAITFLAASRRGTPTDELESIVAAIKGPLVKTEVVAPAKQRTLKQVKQLEEQKSIQEQYSRLWPKAPLEEQKSVQEQFSRRKPKEPAYG